MITIIQTFYPICILLKNIQYLKTDFQNTKHSTENISLKLKTETQWILHLHCYDFNE